MGSLSALCGDGGTPGSPGKSSCWIGFTMKAVRFLLRKIWIYSV